MHNLIKIGNSEIQIKEHKGKRVCTFKDIDSCHARPEGTAKRNFAKNRKHFIKDEDYYLLNKDEAVSTKFVLNAPTGLTVLTESGYLMLVKSFTDDLAWEVQRQLVNNYFRVKAPVALDPDAEYRRIKDLCLECRAKKEYHAGQQALHKSEFQRWARLEAEAISAANLYFSLKSVREGLKTARESLEDHVTKAGTALLVENFLE